MNKIQTLIDNLFLPGLLKSKRFWSALIGMIAVVVAYYEPGLEPYLPQIIEGITIGVVFLVSGYSLEDAVQAAVKAYMEYKDENK